MKERHDIRTDQITIRWIPGHKDVLGNEKADEEARKAGLAKANNSSPRKLPHFIRADPLPDSISALKQAHREKSAQRWLAQWTKSPRYQQMSKLDMDKPSNRFLKLISPLSKKQAAILTGLRTGHIALNKFLHIIRKTEEPSCPHCPDIPETIKHFLFDCPFYQRDRQTLRNTLGRKADNLPALVTMRCHPEVHRLHEPSQRHIR